MTCSNLCLQTTADLNKSCCSLILELVMRDMTDTALTMGRCMSAGSLCSKPQDVHPVSEG